MTKEVGISLQPISGERLRKDVGLKVTLEEHLGEDIQNWRIAWTRVRWEGKGASPGCSGWFPVGGRRETGIDGRAHLDRHF